MRGSPTGSAIPARSGMILTNSFMAARYRRTAAPGWMPVTTSFPSGHAAAAAAFATGVGLEMPALAAPVARSQQPWVYPGS